MNGCSEIRQALKDHMPVNGISHILFILSFGGVEPIQNDAAIHRTNCIPCSIEFPGYSNPENKQLNYDNKSFTCSQNVQEKTATEPFTCGLNGHTCAIREATNRTCMESDIGLRRLLSLRHFSYVIYQNMVLFGGNHQVITKKGHVHHFGRLHIGTCK